LRVSNLSKFGINNDNQQYISESLYEKLKNYQPKKGEILLSKDATPGVAYYLNSEPVRMIPSGGILRLKLKDAGNLYPEYLTLVLNSVVVRKQIERDIGGSVINHWLVDQVKEALIPIFPDALQKEISQIVADSFIKREQAKKLLDIAKRGVEIAIEQGEEKAQNWVNQEVKRHSLTQIPLA
jgi:restriction endonuclease S subunit